MIVKKHTEIKNEAVTTPGAVAASIRWLLGPDSAAPHFHMRLIELKSGGHTPFHTHAGEHEVFVVSGNGRLISENGIFDMKKGHFALVLEGEKHQFENTGKTAFKFICVIPK